SGSDQRSISLLAVPRYDAPACAFKTLLSQAARLIGISRPPFFFVLDYTRANNCGGRKMFKRLRNGLIAGLLFVVASFAAATPQFSLRDTSGAMHTQQEWSDKRAIVVFFTTVDCPLSNGYVPEMNRIFKAYSSRGVAFYAVESDPTVPETQVR